jgi:hypothetical protein
MKRPSLPMIAFSPSSFEVRTLAISWEAEIVDFLFSGMSQI